MVSLDDDGGSEDMTNASFQNPTSVTKIIREDHCLPSLVSTDFQYVQIQVLVLVTSTST
jgi:hypothetical protein